MTIGVTFLILFSVWLLCQGCTVRIEPLTKKTVKHAHIVRHHHAKPQVQGTNGSTGVIGTDENGRTRVTESWMMRYRDLEKMFGNYSNDQSEIEQTDNPHVFAIGSGVRNHFADMKRQQIELHPTPTP